MGIVVFTTYESNLVPIDNQAVTKQYTGNSLVIRKGQVAILIKKVFQLSVHVDYLTIDEHKELYLYAHQNELVYSS